MWQLIVFLTKFLLIGKPKLRTYYIPLDAQKRQSFDDLMKTINEDPKWDIQKIEMIPVGEHQFSAMVYCKEKYT